MVREFNEEFLEELAQMARAGDARSSLAIIWAHRDQWLELDADARRKAARVPLLLIDIQFHNEEWWRSAHMPQSQDPMSADAAGTFEQKAATKLMYHALVLLWHTARCDARAASMMLAIPQQVAVMVASLGLRDLVRIADQHHRHLRPRWEHLDQFWAHLLMAARSGDDEVIRAFRYYSRQLYGKDSSSLFPEARLPRSPISD